MDVEQIKILLERYHQGNCTPEEVALVEQWFDHINQQQPVATNEDELEFDLGNIKSKIDNQLAPAQPVPHMGRWYAVAAAALVMIAAGIFWFTQRKPSGEFVTRPLTTSPLAAIRTVKNGSVEVITPRTIKDTISLQDGSTILLNAGSKLHYPENFSNADRSIWLEEGEAYFDAAEDKARPFIVHTGPLTTTVLGTTFNIRAYALENKVTVALFSGKVKVDHPVNAGSKTSSLVLMPSEQFSFNLHELSLSKSNFAKPLAEKAWQNGFLVFKDASYNELVTRLENHFGITVINRSSKSSWNYTGTFRNESLKDVMETICLATSLSYQINNDTVFLVNKY